MSKFMSPHCNGRARVALANAFLIPPPAIVLLPVFDCELGDLSSVLSLWGALIVLVVIATYTTVAIAKLLRWMRQGLSDAERDSLILMRRLVAGVIVVLSGLAIALFFRYEIIPIAFTSGYFKYDRFTGEVTREHVVKETSRVVTADKPGI